MNDKRSAEFIREYWEEVQEHYPALTFEQLNEVCRSPFLYLKHVIRGYTLESIRFKFFGVFKIQKGRAKDMYKRLDEVLENDRISKAEYNKIKPKLKQFINGK